MFKHRLKRLGIRYYEWFDAMNQGNKITRFAYAMFTRISLKKAEKSEKKR